ncbi:MAG: hypothetical protein P8M72_09995 [Gammaproteobacteria bacterium]|nr:hypothetical protein [Gammaproteobacteria bacterium]
MSGISPDELHALSERIINSGVLGRSKKYGAILRYLVECTLEGQSPKEAAIAVDVLGKDAEFDVGKDSIVRVHIFHLRNKLDIYYSDLGLKEKYRLDIPKGQYIVTTSANTETEEPATSITGKPLDRPSYTPWLAAFVVFLLILNFFPDDELADSAVFSSPLSVAQPWQSLLDDELPILLVIGDYYIFGEVDENGNVLRMVREFDINSREELAELQQRQPATADNYYNLDLSYIPVSIANAMARLVPILGSKADRLSVKMMSELDTADLANNHLIYLGYLSAVDTLLDLMFADSGLSIGATYDELINLETNEYYIGSTGLSGDGSFQDYGMVSAFPAPNGNQFLLIAGMRDEGLVNIAQQMTSPESLAVLMEALKGENPVSFEALYEVFGFDNTNFGGELVYSRLLDTQVIWETRLISNQ